MELTFLGTGTSQGVPMIAQPADSMNLANPRNWRTRTSAHVVMDGLHIQIDAAQEFRIQCIRESVPGIDLFILTHGHADHILGMDDLRRYCDLKGGVALPVYSTPAGLDRVRAIYPYAIGAAPVSRGYPAFELKEMPKQLDLEQGLIQTALLPHGAVEVLGLVFTEKSSGKRLAYYTDCARVTDEAEELARNCDVVVLDALRPAPHPTHMSISQAIDAAQRIGGRKTYFTHMTFQIDHDVDQAKLPDNIYYAWDGLKVIL